ncbi:MAG: single-stranded DNA-binding protein [Planctomycetota bacterium]|nr:single-stranded DNA-binding protein [Planctomycetota bacterium]
MANFNRVILIGNLTRDPQLRYTPSQMAVCDFGVATNRRWTSKDGQKREDTCFVNCTAWGRQAETIQKYLNKGSPIFIEGRLTFSQWEGPDGKKRSKLEVTVERFQFLGSPGGGNRGGGGGRAGAGAADQPSRDAARQETSGEQEQKPPEYDYEQDVEDDTIPF